MKTIFLSNDLTIYLSILNGELKVTFVGDLGLGISGDRKKKQFGFSIQSFRQGYDVVENVVKKV